MFGVGRVIPLLVLLMGLGACTEPDDQPVTEPLSALELALAAAAPELRFHGALGDEVVDIVVDGCKVFLRTAASQAASAAPSAAPSAAASAWEQVLEPDFYPFFTACQRESLQVSQGVVTFTLGRMAMGAGGCCATGGTYQSRDGRIWKKS